MSVEKTDSRLVFVPLEKAIIPPPGLIEHFWQRHWIFDPERGILYWRPETSRGLFPQCNGNPTITESMRTRIYPWAEVLCVESVFRTINPHDY